MASPAFPRARVALLLVDVINLFDFPDGAKYAKAWLPSARRIARLRDRAHKAGVPVVYVNDNFGRWRSDFKTLVSICSEPGRPGAAIAQLLQPSDEDFFVLKPHLSGFHQTPLNMLLESGGVGTVVLAGWAADDCILFTAADAHMLHYRVAVPSDCVASEEDKERRHILAKMRKFLKANTSTSAGMRLRR
jgi:nicotinamidase-related amidase